jgi:hypothetical protein
MSRSGRGRRLAGLVVVLVVVATAGIYFAVRSGVGPLPDAQGCVATAEGYSVPLSITQAENASVIAAVAERRGLPARAISIAIATAYQESKLENLDHGDRDSRGLFQQRPSQGWGTPAQVLDPFYAAGAFFDALVKVPGYASMPISRAAQRVQRSAFPQAYAAHELAGRTVASTMSGFSPAGFSCIVNSQDLPAERARADGLTPRAAAVSADTRHAFGPLDWNHVSGQTGGGAGAVAAHTRGHTLDVSFRPLTAETVRRGWVLAHYLVANANRLHIRRVGFDGRVWSAGTGSADGWRRHRVSSATSARVQVSVW